MLHTQWWERLFASVDARQPDAFARFLTEDASFRYGSNAAVHGRAAIEASVAAVFESLRACSHQLQQRWEIGEVRICRGEVTYTRLDGRKVELPFCNVMTMRGDLIARYEIFIDPTPLAAAPS